MMPLPRRRRRRCLRRRSLICPAATPPRGSIGIKPPSPTIINPLLIGGRRIFFPQKLLIGAGLLKDGGHKKTQKSSSSPLMSLLSFCLQVGVAHRRVSARGHPRVLARGAPARCAQRTVFQLRDPHPSTAIKPTGSLGERGGERMLQIPDGNTNPPFRGGGSLQFYSEGARLKNGLNLISNLG